MNFDNQAFSEESQQTPKYELTSEIENKKERFRCDSGDSASQQPRDKQPHTSNVVCKDTSFVKQSPSSSGQSNEPPQPENGVDVIDELCQIARDGDVINMLIKLQNLDPLKVIELLKRKEKGGRTPLHHAVMAQRLEMCKLLVQQGADINICDDDGNTALHNLVCQQPQESHNISFIESLLKAILNAEEPIDAKNKTKQTPLHLACWKGYIEIVHVLLELKADPTQEDEDGWNALDFAIESENVLCVRLIIGHKKWRETFRGGNRLYYGRSKDIDSPMRRLIREMPEIAEEVFTKFMECPQEKDDKNYGSSSKAADDKNYEVQFDYEFLDDDFSLQMSKNSKGDEVYDGNGRVVKHAVPYTDDINLLKKYHPLNIMVEEKRNDLLRHPLVVSLLNEKWKRFVGLVYILNLLMYLIFMGIFNAYMLEMPPPYFIDSGNATSSCVAMITEAQSSFGRCYHYSTLGIIAKYFIIVFAAFSLFKELSQVYSQRFFYLQNFTNVLEVSLYILAILVVYSDTNSAGPNYYGVREDWQWQIGAVSILLSWMVLIMFVGNLPTFGIYVLMFTEVLQTFTKFFFVFVLFILGFAFSFHCLLQNQYAFRRTWNAVIKTSLMMIGEFGFEDIFLAEPAAIETGADNHTITISTVNYEVISYTIFVFFIIIMSIIIMNLLVGLAVDDIKAVQENAQLESLAMKVKLTLDVQYTLPLFIRRRVWRKNGKFSPNKYRKDSAFIQWWHSVESLTHLTINEALYPEKNLRDKLKQRVKTLAEKIDFLKEKVVTLDNRSRSMDDKVSSIVSHFKIGDGHDDGDSNK